MLKSALRSGFQTLAPKLWAVYSEMRSGKDPEVALLPLVVPRGRVALDVGAHFGGYARALAKLTDRVHAFEPTETADIMARTMPRNVTVHRLALSSHAGMAALTIPRSSSALASLERHVTGDVRTIQVTLATIDTLFPTEDIGFIKIDVEGHESAVLNGARATISRCRPVLLIECEERMNPGGLNKLIHYFRQWKYVCKYLNDGELHDVSEFRHDRDQVQGVSPYINNFFFIPSGHPSIAERRA
jgi:FkbM family methyltransferase